MFGGRAADRFTLSCWLDDLHLSEHFHLVAFCLIEQYCFTTKLGFVTSVFARNDEKFEWFCGYLNSGCQTSHGQFPHIFEGCSITQHQCSNLFLLSYDGSCVYVYNLLTRCWSGLPKRHMHHRNGQLELLSPMCDAKRLFLMGGANASNQESNIIEEFDFDATVWGRLTPMSMGRLDFASVVVDQNNVDQKHVVVVGGCGAHRYGCGFSRANEVKVVEMYNKETNYWMTLAQTPFHKSSFFSTMHN